MIHLRKLEPTDLPFLYQWENDALMWADSETHNPLSRQDLRAYIQSTTGDIYCDGQLRLMICEKKDGKADDGATLGCVDLFDFDARNRKAAIGLYVSPAARGRGVGRETMVQLMHYAFDFLHLRMLYAVVRTTNEACMSIYRDLNFTPSAVLKGWTLEGDVTIWQRFAE